MRFKAIFVTDATNHGYMFQAQLSGPRPHFLKKHFMIKVYLPVPLSTNVVKLLFKIKCSWDIYTKISINLLIKKCNVDTCTIQDGGQSCDQRS